MHCIHVARWRWGKGRGCRSNLKGETRDCPTLHRASFRTGLLPASAEPTGNTGGTSEKTWMIKHCTATAGEKSWINFTISTADTKASKDEGAGDALSTRAEIPLQPTKTTAGINSCCSQSLSEQIFMLQPAESPHYSRLELWLASKEVFSQWLYILSIQLLLSHS